MLHKDTGPMPTHQGQVARRPVGIPRAGEKEGGSGSEEDSQETGISASSWRRRDAVIKKRLANHPCTVEHFLDLFPSRATAYRRLAKLRNKQRIRYIGTVMMKDEGRPRDVYCDGWRPKTDHLRHEVLLTDFLLQYDEFATITRGYNCDKIIQPDAEMSMCGQKFYVELDTGTVNHTRQRRRWKLYRKVTEEFLLVVTSTSERMANLIANARDVESIALFTTLDEAINDPLGTIWRACKSPDTVALPSPDREM